MAASHRDGQVITFYSFKGGVGRTMALANIAWILASTGRRVLTVDWDLESPGLHRYFAPFLADRDLRQSPGVIDSITRFVQVASAAIDGSDRRQLRTEEIDRLARIQGYASSLERYEFPRGGSIDFVPSGQQIAEYSHIVSNFDWEDFYTRLNGDEFLLALAEDMRRNYDVALIDSRTGLSDNAGICTVTLPDTVVNCFAFNNQSIDGAVAVARSIRRLRPDGIRMFPVPTRVEDGEAAKLDRRRSLARQRFDEYVTKLGYPDPSKYWGMVEIPYKVFYAYEETLATFGDRPYQENTLLAAYERLAGELVGEDCAFAGLSETVRRGWLAEFEQRGSANPGPVVICYTPRDRIWAEWVSHQLRAIGQRSKLQDIGATSAAAETLAQADAVILLLSQETIRIPQTHLWWDLAVKRDLPGSGRFLVPVRIDGFRLPAPFGEREPVDMFNVLEQHARDALFARLDVRDAGDVVDAALPGGPGPRFPFEPARVWRAPARNPGFTGRDATLEELRERLNSSTALAGPAVLQGIGGVGKTQIAIEYLHRFAADYDVVWWISADQPALVVTALADLARELELPTVGRADEQVAAVLEALRLGSPSPRWIIIFDNTDDPEQIRSQIPTGAGDVIITTPGQEWSRQAWTLDINVFDRSESATLLTRRVPGLSEADADAIAAKLGDLPLAVEQAATWLATTAMSARNYLEILDEQLPRILNEPPPPGYRHPAAETWRLSQQRLREANPAAALLVELCAFLAPEPIPTGLLDSPGMIDVLATVNPTLRDQLLRGSLVREVARFGLARVDSAVNALRMHRLVQSVIRGDLTIEDQLIRQGQTHVILAKVQRGEPDDQANWAAYRGLQTHLEPSKALESDDPEVQRLVIDVVRYLRYRGDLAGGQGLAERTLAQWRPRLGEDHESVLRMRTELANLLREHGEYRPALEMHEDATARLTRTLGETHPYTLVARNGAAADLRGLGEYRRAREMDEQTVVRWQATMGDDHHRTLMAANNLATSLRLVGEFQRARLLDEDTLRRYEKSYPDHRSTFLTRTNYGRDLREVGELAKAHAALDRAWSDCRAGLGETHPYTMIARKSLAVTLRRLGQLEDAGKVIEQTLADFERSYRPHHPERLACELEGACMKSAQGDHEAAQTRTREVVSRYQQVLGADHPFTLAATNDLAIFLVRAGDYEQAGRLLTDAVARFEEVLAGHPYTTICQMNLANAHFGAGDIDKAYELDERCLRQLRAHFANRGHPAIIAATANLVASRSASGDRPGAYALREETLPQAVETLGTDHRYVTALRDGGRINSDIEPLVT
jgi:MinD-like ATPase involved in chromosome partitioning or flagellar assembly/tetratricopeptide (TPR) repeat protein